MIRPDAKLMTIDEIRDRLECIKRQRETLDARSARAAIGHGDWDKIGAEIRKLNAREAALMHRWHILELGLSLE